MAADVLEVKAGRRVVPVKRPDKVLFPAVGATKADLARYLVAVAPVMLALVRDRPVNLQIAPNGTEGRSLFLQAAPKHFPAWVGRVETPKRDGTVVHALVQDAATLAYFADQAVVTTHVWTSRRDRLRDSDRLIWDLDPSDGQEFAVIREAALALRGLLVEETGREPLAMVSGSRGIHVVLPVRRGSKVAAELPRAVADELVARDPDRLTRAFKKAERGGRTYVDIGRSTYAHTAVAPYSPRARAHAPVATPVGWDEVEDPALRPDQFGFDAVLARLRDRGCSWTGRSI